MYITGALFAHHRGGDVTEQLLNKLLTKKQPAPTTMLTFRVSPELLAKIEAISERVSKPRSKVIKLVLEQGSAEQFGYLMNEHWQRKRARSAGMSNPTIDELYELGMANGAVGGKLVGAGAGGFLMFYASDAGKLRDAFRQRGLEEVVFRFDHDGSTILSRG